jgi:choline dehydrogenase-like flavoprotein
LRIVFNTTVQKILFDESASSTPKATGVLATIDGETEELKATKEVLLAAGAFNTPKLLELSGLGNKEILEKHGIKTIVDLPGVGENLQDHLMTGVSYEVVDGVVTGDPLMRQEPEALKMAQELYVQHRAGPLTIGGVQSNAFMPTENAGALLDKYPPKPEDQELYDIIRGIYEEPNPGASAVWFMFLAQANLHEGAKKFVGTQLLPNNFASFGCSQAHPFSRGSTHIGSSNVEDAPVIDPAYFSHPADLEIMARHVQGFNKLREAKALDPFFKKDGQRNHPDAYKVADLEEAKKYILDTATTTFHPCGTAALLPRGKKGVVDPELKVYGTEGLRIVDSSIIPLIPRGNIQSTVYAVAERASDIIKGN